MQEVVVSRPFNGHKVGDVLNASEIPPANLRALIATEMVRVAEVRIVVEESKRGPGRPRKRE